MKENRLRWFGHVPRRGISELVKKIESWNSGDLRKTARKMEDDLEKDMNDLKSQIEMVDNRIEWRRRIHVDDHWN